MGGITLRVEKQNPVESCNGYPECELQFVLPVNDGVGNYHCYGACGRIEIGRGETQLPAMEPGGKVTIAPCGREIVTRLDN